MQKQLTDLDTPFAELQLCKFIHSIHEKNKPGLFYYDILILWTLQQLKENNRLINVPYFLHVPYTRVIT